MADYSIFALGESQIAVSNGRRLDGVTQGDGSHLEGASITFKSSAWEEVRINDDDPNFQNNDGSQQLDGNQSFDGVTYSGNTKVKPEYSIVLTDGTESWIAVAFNVNKSTASYGTIEGLAFVEGPGGFPPVGVELMIASASKGPTFAATAYAKPMCFARGTLIETARGPCPIETLRIGDLIQTADHGLQPLRWAGGRHVLGVGRFAPVQIAAGHFGAERDLIVSQKHRILVSSPATELHFGESQVLVPALHLADGNAVRVLSRVTVEYFHLLLDRHEVIFTDGVASESLHVNRAEPGVFADMVRFFPELADLEASHSVTARRCLARQEAAMLVAQAGGVERLDGLRHSARDTEFGGQIAPGSSKEQGHGARSGLRNWVFGRNERRAG